MSNHTTNKNSRKAGEDILALKVGISGISSSNLLERKNNTVRSGMVSRSLSRSLQLSPLKIRALVGVSNKGGVRSRQGRPGRVMTASAAAVIEVRSRARENLYEGGVNRVLGSYDEVGVAFMLTQMIQVGGARFEAVQAEMRDQCEMLRSIHEELRDQLEEQHEQRKVLQEMREEQWSVQRDALDALREDLVQQAAVIASLSAGQAEVSETLAVLRPIRKEFQWLREASQQLHKQVRELDQQFSARISTVEQQVGTLQDAVAQQRDDLFEAVEFVVDERTEKRIIVLEDVVRQVLDKDMQAHVLAQEADAKLLDIAVRRVDAVAADQCDLVGRQERGMAAGECGSAHEGRGALAVDAVSCELAAVTDVVERLDQFEREVGVRLGGMSSAQQELCDRVKRVHQDLDAHFDMNRKRLAASKEELGMQMEMLAGVITKFRSEMSSLRLAVDRRLGLVGADIAELRSQLEKQQQESTEIREWVRETVGDVYKRLDATDEAGSAVATEVVAHLEESIRVVRGRVDGVERTLTSNLDRHTSHCHNKFISKVDFEHTQQQLEQLVSRVTVLNAEIKSSGSSMGELLDERMGEFKAESQRDWDEVYKDISELWAHLEHVQASLPTTQGLQGVGEAVEYLHKDHAEMLQVAALVTEKLWSMDQLRTDYASVLEGLSGTTDQIQKLDTFVQQLQGCMCSHVQESNTRHDQLVGDYLVIQKWVADTHWGMGELQATFDGLQANMTTTRGHP